MQAGFEPEGRTTNAAPLIIFDGDTDSSPDTTNCGFTLASAVVEAQYQSATDYKGMSIFLSMAGLSTSLVPTTAANRDVTISTSDLGFYRPTNIAPLTTLGSGAALELHQGMPQYQGNLSDTNRFTYFFTNEAGGRVYPSGFNEEGYQVTASGLVDIETGDTFSPWV